MGHGTRTGDQRSLSEKVLALRQLGRAPPPPLVCHGKRRRGAAMTETQVEEFTRHSIIDKLVANSARLIRARLEAMTPTEFSEFCDVMIVVAVASGRE